MAHSLLDESFPLEGEATWSDVTALSVAMRDGGAASLQLSLASGGEAVLPAVSESPPESSIVCPSLRGERR